MAWLQEPRVLSPSSASAAPLNGHDVVSDLKGLLSETLQRVMPETSPTAPRVTTSDVLGSRHTARQRLKLAKAMTRKPVLADSISPQQNVIPQQTPHPQQADDYYQLLGLDPNASKAEIRQATKQQLDALKKAYQILVDDDKRRAYDAALATQAPTQTEQVAGNTTANIEKMSLRVWIRPETLK